MSGGEGLRVIQPPAETAAGELIEFPTPTPEQVDDAIACVMHDTKEIYMGFRGAPGYGTERAILPEEPHVPHRENDAEHSWHVAYIAQMLYHNRDRFGLSFSEDFSIEKSVIIGVIHDTPEIKSRDVDTLTHDLEAIEQKEVKEEEAITWLRKAAHRRWNADLCDEYSEKDSAEALFIHDVDKIVGCAVIAVDGGRRWHNWEGNSASLAFMLDRQRAKLKTDNGIALFDAMERYLRERPGLFPEGMWTQAELF